MEDEDFNNHMQQSMRLGCQLNNEYLKPETIFTKSKININIKPDGQ